MPDYPHRQYEVGRLLLTLRNKVRLTQAELAGLVGVSWRSVHNWESGKSYPTEEHLRALIATLVEYGAFTAGRERDEAEALWQQVTQDAPQRLGLFDATWFRGLVPGPGRVTLLAPDMPSVAVPDVRQGALTAQPSSRRIDWGEAVDVLALFGREDELARLRHWVVGDACRVVALLGSGGIGKTSLGLTLARLVAPDFDHVIFRSMRNAPPLSQLLGSLIRFISNQQYAQLPSSVADRLALLLTLLRERRSLIVLDNLDSLLQEGLPAGRYREGYEAYSTFVQRLAESAHQSCLLLTSREKPRELGLLESAHGPARTLVLRGLDIRACQALLADRGVDGTGAEWGELVRRYGGNPLALKLVSEPIRELFGGAVGLFLASDAQIFADVRDLLDQQFARLSELEQDVMTWLAIGREPLAVAALQALSLLPAGMGDTLDAMGALRRRFLIERSTDGVGFTLQPVVMEYVTERLVGQVYHEIMEGRQDSLRRYALMQAQAPEYVRQSQVRVLVQPLLAQLLSSLKSSKFVEQRLRLTLSALRTVPRAEQGYGAGNVLNVLVQLSADLHDWDFSDLNVWQACLEEVEAPGVNFSRADLRGSLFTETFGGVWDVTFSRDGAYLAAGSEGGQIRVWRVADRQSIHVFAGHAGRTTAVAFSPEGNILASAGFDGAIILWSLARGERLATLRGHHGWVWSVDISPNGMYVASGSQDQSVKLWDIATGECLMTLEGHTATVFAVAFSPDGTRLASGSVDKTIKLWDVATGQCVATLLTGHSADIRSIAFSPDGGLVATGSQDRTIELWDVDNATCVATLEGHTAPIWSLAFSPNGTHLASGSLDQSLKVWDVAQRTCLATFLETTGPIYSVAFSSDGDTIACGGESQAVALWSLTRQECLALWHGHNETILTLAFSPDGTTLASAGFDRVVRLWSIPRRALLSRLTGHTAGVIGLDFSPEGGLATSCLCDHIVRLWDLVSGRCRGMYAEHRLGVLTVAFSPDGVILATGGEDQTIRLWDVPSGTCIATLRGHHDWIRKVAFSPDGTLLVSGSFDATVKLWSIERKECIQTWGGHTGAVRSVAFSPDGGQVASASADQTIRLWSVADGASLATLQGHVGLVNMVVFSLDGQTLASSSSDGTVRLWSTATGACLATLDPKSGSLEALACSSDGRTLAAAGAGGRIMLWDLSSQELVAVLSKEPPYARMNITGVTGLSDAQRAALRALGAVENDR